MGRWQIVYFSLWVSSWEERVWFRRCWYIGPLSCWLFSFSCFRIVIRLSFSVTIWTFSFFIRFCFWLWGIFHRRWRLVLFCRTLAYRSFQWYSIGKHWGFSGCFRPFGCWRHRFPCKSMEVRLLLLFGCETMRCAIFLLKV